MYLQLFHTSITDIECWKAAYDVDCELRGVGDLCIWNVTQVSMDSRMLQHRCVLFLQINRINRSSSWRYFKPWSHQTFERCKYLVFGHCIFLIGVLLYSLVYEINIKKNPKHFRLRNNALNHWPGRDHRRCGDQLTNGYMNKSHCQKKTKHAPAPSIYFSESFIVWLPCASKNWSLISICQEIYKKYGLHSSTRY